MLIDYQLIDPEAIPVTQWADLPPDTGDDHSAVDPRFVPPVSTTVPPEFHRLEVPGVLAQLAPLPRMCHVGCVGPDVLAYKRGLVAAKVRDPDHEKGLTAQQHRTFGSYMVGNVRAFQHRNGLTADGIIGPHTYAALYRYLDAYGRLYLLPRERHILARPVSLTAEILHHALRSVALNAYWHYREIRPFPVWEPADHIPTTTDCSGHYGLMREWAHAPSPFGSFGWSGYGNSDTILANGQWVSSPEPGDAVVYTNPGHVITCVSWPMGVSFGSEEGPYYLDCRYRPITGFRRFPS